MPTFALIALIILLVLLFRWLGHPTRRPPEEKKPNAPNPEQDIPPPVIMS